MIKHIKINNLKEWDKTLNRLHNLGYKWMSGDSLSEVKHHEYFTDDGRNYIGFSDDYTVGCSSFNSEELKEGYYTFIPNIFLKNNEELE